MQKKIGQIIGNFEVGSSRVPLAVCERAEFAPGWGCTPPFDHGSPNKSRSSWEVALKLGLLLFVGAILRTLGKWVDYCSALAESQWRIDDACSSLFNQQL
jgi:hypothetical protein